MSKPRDVKLVQLIHNKGPYHLETSPNGQWTIFYMAGTYVMKEFTSISS